MKGQVKTTRISKVSDLVHLGQALANRVKPGLSIKIWMCESMTSKVLTLVTKVLSNLA